MMAESLMLCSHKSLAGLTRKKKFLALVKNNISKATREPASAKRTKTGKEGTRTVEKATVP
jgi:hypothetical protein